ncbi:MAG: immunoglobulin domain-containing protein, partial [Opitutaceae bacterium]
VMAAPGELFGAGLSEYGSLGDLSAQGSVARLAKQLWPAGSTEGVVQVAAAGRHSLIMTSAGKVYGMGHNFASALGIVSNAASYPTPELILDNVRQVAAAQDNSYFLRRDGTLWGVGTTQQGMLGEYYPGAGSTVPFQLVPGQNNIIGVWAGGSAGNGGCVYLTRDGQLFLLGGPSVYAPVRLDTGVVDAAQGAGFQLWVKADGSLWAQGSNTFGQLGTGGTTAVASPQKVPVDDVARVFAGPSFAFFIKRNGSLWAMGRNTFGQLGIGSPDMFRATPTLVMDSVSSVASGERHAIFLKSDGSVWTMGNNYYGQLGDGTAEERRAPVPIASNAVAVAAGAYYSLHVAPVAPTITTQPEGKALVAGGGATLSVVAAGSPVLLYQWKKDTVDVPGGTAATLSLAAVTANQAGSYVVVVSNGRGSVTSAAAVVTVDQTPTAPSIVTHPTGQAVKTGGTATFTVRAAGTGTLGYQWRRNEVAVVGATSASYTLPSVQFAQVGAYDVVVTNSVGSATSAPATLSLIDILPPVITRDPLAVATTPGQRVEFAVEATGTNLRYQWRKDSVEIAGATGRIFTLSAALVADAGAYSVVVSNELGRAISATALLKVDSVQGAMKVVGSEGLLSAGGTFTLELGVNFIGTAPVQLGWTLVLPPGFSYSGGENEPEVKPSVGNTGSIDWAYVTIPTGSATFRVRIAYVAGLTGKHSLFGTVSYRTSSLPSSVSPAPVTVFRVDSPTITRQPVPVFAVSGTPASFSVEAQGGELAYQWFRNGLAVPGATFSTFAFDPVRGTDAGDYMVRVSNAVAAVDSNVVKLTVFEVVAGHAVQGPGYVEGQNIEISNTITFSGGDAFMGWQVLMPKGWTFVSSSGDAGDVRPQAGASDLLEWAWNSFPVSPVNSSYTLKVPAGVSGPTEIAALLTFVRGGKSGQVLAKPDPLKVDRVGWHSADLDRSFTFSLFELLRVIELYNTRRGTVRTGAYQVAQGSEDGFAPDFDRASGAPLTLATYHSADYGRDGSVNLLELLRMIELYNFSANRSRTGQFHRSAGTEDGFAPGPAPATGGGAGIN